MSTAKESAIVSGRSPPPRVVTRRATDSFLIGYLPERKSRGEATAMSPEVGSDASSPKDRDVKGLSVTIPPIEAPRDASRRGGRIDFDTATDLVDQASQESFPASNSPARTFTDIRRCGPERDWTMRKKDFTARRQEQPPPGDAPGGIPQTTIGPPPRDRAAAADHSASSTPGGVAGRGDSSPDSHVPGRRDEERPMSADPRRIIVTESCCQACDVHTVQVYHRSLPEMRIEGLTSQRAADILANRLTASLDSVSDPSHREAVRVAIDDTRAFLDREEAVHPARDLSDPGAR